MPFQPRSQAAVELALQLLELLHQLAIAVRQLPVGAVIMCAAQPEFVPIASRRK